MSNRFYGLDFFRLLAVIMVFLFHSSIHIDCDYGIATSFIRCGPIFMTAFFILSGFLIYYVSFDRMKEILPFLKKRIIAIMSAYWGLCIIYPMYNIIISMLQRDSDNLLMIIKDNLLLLPIEILGLQSAFDSLFSISHNGGTWFVSCLLFCYFSFPLTYQITKELTMRGKKMSLGIISILLVYASLVPHIFNINFIYSNILFRIFEFTIGVLLASIIISNKKRNFLGNWYAFSFEVIILIAGALIGKALYSTNDFMIHEWCAIPCFILMIITLTSIKTPRWLQSKIVSYGCEISYVFFFAQFFTWTPVMIILRRIGLEENNLIKFFLSIFLCTVLAIVLHEFMEKPIKKLLQKNIL